MAEKYTLEQLQQMGAKPVESPPSAGMSLQEVQAQGAQPVPKVGAAETFFQRGAQALPLGSLVSNLLSTGAYLALRPSPGAVIPEEAKSELASMGIQVEEPESAVEAYRDIRDTRRLRTAAGSEQNPNAARAGTALGIAASIAAPLPKTGLGGVKDAAGVLQMGRAARIGNAALTGGLYGGVNGLTDGEADLTQGDVPGVLRDTAEGAGWGAALGGLFGAAAEGVRPLAGALRRFAVRQGKQTIQGGSDIAAATREPLADDAVEEVLQSGGIKPFSTTQATATRIERLAAESGDEYGRIVAELETAGVKGPDAEALATQLLDRAARLEPRTMNTALPAELLSRAEQFARQGESLERATGSRALGLTQAEDLKRSLQEMVRYGKLEETPLNAVRREIASVLRQANEDAVGAAGQAAGAGSRIRALADRFVPVKQRTGRLLEAERFAQKGSSKAEQRSPVSFKDLLVGSMTGEPISGLAVSAGSSIARNRMPSTLSSGAWNLSEGLRTGSLSSEVAGAMGGAAELLGDEVQSRADRAAVDERTDPITAALIYALRRPKRDGKDKEKR